QPKPSLKNGKYWLANASIVFVNESPLSGAGNACAISKKAGIKVNAVVILYTIASFTNNGEVIPRIMRVIANGYRNIKNGVDHVMIWFRPRFAKRNDNPQLNLRKVL